MLRPHSLPVLLASLLFIQGVQAATRVPIVIDEPQPGRTVAWPVTTGIPFPRGGLSKPDNCRLVDDRGQERPLQSKVAATWDVDRKSIRWLTIDFVAEPGRTYALEFGNGIRRKHFESPLIVEQGETLSVQTGALRADFSQTGKSALDGFAVDLNGDGVIADDEVVARGAADGDHYYLDGQGRRFTSAADGKDRQIVVESDGPVRACVRIDGWYTGPDSERTVAYRTRYHFFAGLGLVKIIDEFRIAGSTKETEFADVGLALDLHVDTSSRTVSADASGTKGNQAAMVTWNKTTTSVSSYQATYRHLGNTKYDAALVEVSSQGERRIAEPNRIGEWMQVADRRAAVTGSLRWMWQQFPKEWEATSDRFTLHLWSPRGGQLDFGRKGFEEFFGPAGDKYLLNWKGVRGTLSPISNYFYFAGREALQRGDADGRGINKHHEVYLHFAAAAQKDASVEYGMLAARQPLALASGQWNCSTDVFGPLAARPNDSKYEQIVDQLFDLGRYGQDSFGDYGWWLFGSGPHYSYQWDAKQRRHYADPRRFEYHTYQKETQLWWCYLRSGERKFHDWAFPSENHWVDVAVSHQPQKFRSRWKGGRVDERTLHWPRGDWPIDSPLHYLRHHDTGEAWLRGGSQFWASYHRTLETTTLAYYLTGDERYNDVVKYWTAYWGDLAAKTSASDDVQPWHREQAWFKPTGPGEKPKTWAEMIRDYAPFTSGSRHQQTLFFNLATLYEHTWNPKIRQVLDDYADAFLEPDGPIGVWRSQENSLPAYADAPKLSHYWVPALWKYARASGDPRMKKIFERYFDRMWLADPFREDVGVYSNVQIAYAYYFTRDSRHLRPARLELDRLLPHAEPLSQPQDLGRRIYNPYAPIESYTAVPRLIGALKQAERDGVAIPPPARLPPQRSPIAVFKPKGKALQVTLWGFDREVSIIGPDGAAFRDARIESRTGATDLQPFDRNLPGFEVYLHGIVIASGAAEGYYVLSPRLEMAVLAVSDQGAVLCSAAQPLAIEPQQQCRVILPAVAESLELESAAAASLRLFDDQGDAISAKISGNRLVATDTVEPRAVVHVKNANSRKAWFRIVGEHSRRAWATFTTGDVPHLPTAKQDGAALRPTSDFDPTARFAQGRFGDAVQIVAGRKLHLPDHIVTDGEKRKLFDQRQGTIEFWIKRLWDERMTTTRPVTFLDNGLVKAWSPWKLPVGEWAHVAVVWRPYKRDPSQNVVHVYVDGLDRASYRSTWWQGYSRRPFSFKAGKWLEEFVSQAPPGAAFAIDELRISSVARYADLNIEFGGSQTYNPYRFAPSQDRPAVDKQTELLFRFDGNLKNESATRGGQVSGRFSK